MGKDLELETYSTSHAKYSLNRSKLHSVYKNIIIKDPKMHKIKIVAILVKNY